MFLGFAFTPQCPPLWQSSKRAFWANVFVIISLAIATLFLL